MTEEVKRGRGRPPKAKNKVKINDALDRADKLSMDAVILVGKFMNGQVPGCTPAQQLAAAGKIIELALTRQKIVDQNKALDEKSNEKSNAKKELPDVPGPKFSLVPQ